YVVFGYGSLIFEPPPHVVSQVSGYMKGYVRRFAQKLHDHRGTPENPGRVTTLIHKEDWDAFSGADAFPEEDIVWGVAYTIDPLYQSEVRDYLDYREKDGYTLKELDVYGLKGGKECIQGSCLFRIFKCYVGQPDNPSFSEP
ncbi:ChaC-like protein, partial [Cytidiella melzeri]